jgi:uncharacterized membrane protein HdeD (DUF308 family)
MVRKFSGIVGWTAVLLGVLTLIVGVFLIADPHETLKTLAVIIGILLVLDGIIALCTAIFGAGQGRGLLAIAGILSLIVGLILIKKPFVSLAILVLIIGIWLIVVGVARIAEAVSSKEERGVNIFVGLIDIIVGIVFLAWPHIGAATFAVVLGIFLVIRGLLFIAGGFMFRSAGHEAADLMA